MSAKSSINGYETLYELTHEMLQCARKKQWSELVALQEQHLDALDKLMQDDNRHELSEELSVRKQWLLNQSNEHLAQVQKLISKRQQSILKSLEQQSLTEAD